MKPFTPQGIFVSISLQNSKKQNSSKGMVLADAPYPLKRQEKNDSENVVCWSRLLQIIA